MRDRWGWELTSKHEIFGEKEERGGQLGKRVYVRERDRKIDKQKEIEKQTDIEC